MTCPDATPAWLDRYRQAVDEDGIYVAPHLPTRGLLFQVLKDESCLAGAPRSITPYQVLDLRARYLQRNRPVPADDLPDGIHLMARMMS